MSTRTRRLTAVLLVAGAVLANAAFLGLGAVFDYPDVLQQPADQALGKFAADQGAIVTLFCLLALGAGLLAPIAILIGRLTNTRLGRWSMRAGVAAAAVQVIGLLRWPLLVPSLAARATDPAASAAARADATSTFELLHTILGTVVGETLGYLLTAAWTVLVVWAVGHRIAGRWFAVLGVASAVLIVMGVAVPLGLPAADLANFLGYLLWSGWLLAFAALLWRPPVVEAGRPDRPAERRFRCGPMSGSAGQPSEAASALPDFEAQHWQEDATDPMRMRSELLGREVHQRGERYHGMSWPACATSPSACRAGPAGQTSPPRCATIAATPPTTGHPGQQPPMNPTSPQHAGTLPRHHRFTPAGNAVGPARHGSCDPGPAADSGTMLRRRGSARNDLLAAASTGSTTIRSGPTESTPPSRQQGSGP